MGKVQTYLLEDVVWHNLSKVQFLYSTALKVTFPVDIDQIHRAISIRHDLVHRNGRSVSGRFHVFTISDIDVLLENIGDFVGAIDEQLKNIDSDTSK